MREDGTAESDAPSADGRWQSRPVAALAVRALVFAIPILLTIGTSLVAGSLLPPPDGLAGTLVWWGLLVGISVCVLVIAMRVCRRALPLAALLSLSLAFPDAAPSRFKLARRTSSARQLERELQAPADRSMDDHVDHRSGRREVEKYERGRRAEDILALVAALSVHDSRTRGHSERVRVFADMIAHEMALSTADSDRLRWAALLHDIGKIEVAANVLNKPGRPDEDEWQLLQRHPEEGARILQPLAPWMGQWVHAAEHHHERWDGTGYPHGLAGEQISLAGRVVAVADAYETMTAVRAYKKPMSAVAAREELVRCSGAHFDPTVVRAFLNISAGRLWRAVGVGALFAQVPLLGPLIAAFTRSGQTGPTVGTASVALAALGVLGLLTPAIPPRQQVDAASTPQAGPVAAAPSAPRSETPAVPPAVVPPADTRPAAAVAALAAAPAPPAVVAAAPVLAIGPAAANPPAPPVTRPRGAGPGASGFTPGKAGLPVPGQGGAAPGKARKL